mmetsp:Transcript_2795/g.7832  ORF Transcript_2795/g.7832 Transcript_2795/m.7832 type:complete len:279 (+) Transcript_2795:131-967(+)
MPRDTRQEPWAVQITLLSDVVLPFLVESAIPPLFSTSNDNVNFERQFIQTVRKGFGFHFVAVDIVDGNNVVRFLENGVVKDAIFVNGLDAQDTPKPHRHTHFAVFHIRMRLDNCRVDQTIGAAFVADGHVQELVLFVGTSHQIHGPFRIVAGAQFSSVDPGDVVAHLELRQTNVPGNALDLNVALLTFLQTAFGGVAVFQDESPFFGWLALFLLVESDATKKGIFGAKHCRADFRGEDGGGDGLVVIVARPSGSCTSSSSSREFGWKVQLDTHGGGDR